MATRVIQGTADDVIIVQEECFPVVCTTWIKSPSARVIEEYFRWINESAARAHREGITLVNITDAGLTGVPSADVRRLIAERTQELETSKHGGAIHSITVVESAVIRGVLSALSWLHGDLKTEVVSSRKEALDRSSTWLRVGGHIAPPDMLRLLSTRPSR